MRGLGRIGAVALLIGGLVAVGAPAWADDDGQRVIVTVPAAEDGIRRLTNAELRWSVNPESGAGAFAGGCNFLSAGAAGDTGGARVWTAADGFYAASAGAVSIVKPNASGAWVPASFEGRCLDRSGNPVTAARIDSFTENQLVIRAGTGTVDPDGGISIRWTGAFTVAFYGGMTYWSAADPVLTLDAAGNGRLTATASGYGTSMEDLSQWVPIPGRSIVLAELRGADVRASGGFSVQPEYLGVAAPTGGQIASSPENAAYWGSFPQSFIAFQQLTGQTGYWLTTGGQRDRAKPPTPVFVNFDANAPAVVPPAVGGSGAGAGGGVIDNAVRFRAATAPPAVAAVAPLPTWISGGGSAVSATRAGEGLVPAAGGLGTPELPLLLGGSVAALLLAALCALSLLGVPINPFRASRHGG